MKKAIHILICLATGLNLGMYARLPNDYVLSDKKAIADGVMYEDTPEGLKLTHDIILPLIPLSSLGACDIVGMVRITDSGVIYICTVSGWKQHQPE